MDALICFAMAHPAWAREGENTINNEESCYEHILYVYINI